jgi:hypothetical protein
MNVKINYTTIESIPLPLTIVASLNYTNLVGPKEISETIFKNIHDSDWNTPTVLTNNFRLHKINQSLQDVPLSNTYHIIYFDAFAPEKQVEMWTSEIFQKLYHCLYPGGVLVTYCAKGAVKRSLRSVGFEIEILVGPPGKREMTRAFKSH